MNIGVFNQTSVTISLYVKSCNIDLFIDIYNTCNDDKYEFLVIVTKHHTVRLHNMGLEVQVGNVRILSLPNQ